MPLRSLPRLAALALALLPLGLAAQEPAPPLAPGPGRVLTDADYRFAESRMFYKTDPLVAHAVNSPTFLDNTRFWYRDASPARSTYLLVDATTKSITPAFDHAALANAIAAILP